jgi:hypothetical protein
MVPDKLFINLKILGKIQKNGRICRSYDGIISLENDTFYQSVKRTLSSDSRKQSIFEINSIINECIECLNGIVNSRYMNKLQSNTDDYFKSCEDIALILKELAFAKSGIENLKFTYTVDANVESQLDIIIVKIQSTLKDMNFRLNHFKSFLPPYKLSTLTNSIQDNFTSNTTHSNFTQELDIVHEISENFDQESQVSE